MPTEQHAERVVFLRDIDVRLIAPSEVLRGGHEMGARGTHTVDEAHTHCCKVLKGYAAGAPSIARRKAGKDQDRDAQKGSHRPGIT